MQIKLLVIPKPADGTASIIQSSEQTFPPRPLVKGEGEGRGEVDLLCGKCGFAIVQHVESRNTVQGIVLKCPSCSAYNETPLAAASN